MSKQTTAVSLLAESVKWQKIENIKTLSIKALRFFFLLFFVFSLCNSVSYAEESTDEKMKMLMQLLESRKEGGISDEDIKKEIGADRPTAFTPEQRPNIELTLKSSAEQPIAGELWTIFATITNHSTFPVWIVDRATTLSYVPELAGRSNKAGSMGAFFPTVRSHSEDEIIRIEPNSSYIVTFKLDPMRMTESSKKDDEKPNKTFWQALLGENIANSITQFAFFAPGIYEISSVVHIWVKPPEIEKGKVKNFGDTMTISSSITKSIDSSPWVLIFGASIGGILCFLLRKSYENGAVQPSTVQTQAEVVENVPTVQAEPNPIMQKLVAYPILTFLILRSIAGMKWLFYTIPVEIVIKKFFWETLIVRISWKLLFLQFLLKGILPAVLLTGVGTILLSRLSTTNFLLAVKITDIWGAIVVGFMLQWGGYTLLNRIMTQALEKAESNQTEPH